jgi:hypothetical protein
MKKEKLFLRHRYGKAERMALDPVQTLERPSRQQTYRNKPIVSEKG